MTQDQSSNEAAAEDGRRKPAVLEILKDAGGREVARKLHSDIVGELWLTKNRETAVRLGLIRPNDASNVPVYFMESGEIGWLKDASEDGLRKYHSWKKMFDSPEPIENPLGKGR